MPLLGSLRSEGTRVSCGLMHQKSEVYRAYPLTLEQVLHGLSKEAMSALGGRVGVTLTGKSLDSVQKVRCLNVRLPQTLS